MALWDIGLSFPNYFFFKKLRWHPWEWEECPNPVSGYVHKAIHRSLSIHGLKYRLSHKTCRLMSHFEFNLIFVMLDTSRSRKEHDWTLGMKSAAIKENSFHITYLIYSFRWHTIAFTLSKVLLVSEHGECKGGTLISLLDRTVATGDFSWVMT